MQNLEATLSLARNGRGPCILLLEDEVSHRALLRAHLCRHDVRFLEASSAEEGLRLARECRPDLILLDILMPPRNAWYALRELKRDPATRDIPVIVVTIVDDKTSALSLGADGYIHKPFRGETLRQQVNRFIGGYDGEEDSAG